MSTMCQRASNSQSATNQLWCNAEGCRKCDGPTGGEIGTVSYVSSTLLLT
jgi:hypothetical protein